MTPRISSCQFPSFRHLLLHAMIALLLVLVSVANASSAPTVTLTKPVEGTVMPMAGNLLSIKVSGTAVPSGTTKIAKVEVLDGAKVIASTATGTLTDLATLGLTMGAHTIQLKATDSVGGISYSTPVNITLTGTPPTSVITVPEMGGTYGTKTGTSTIAVTGNAVGTTGASIAKIEVYEGATLLGQPAVANPASLNLTFALGAHTIEWRVTDGRGMTSSSFTSFTVVPAVPPTVVVTSPANGAEVPMTGNLFSIKVSGSATLYDHTRLVRLDVMDGDASIYGTTVASTLDNVPTLGLKKGPHAIWLKATDNLGQVTASAINNITLTGTPPATTLTSPEQGGRYGTVGAKGNVTFSGTVAGTSGATITKIEVWEGGTLVGGVPIATSTSATFAFTLGAHTAEWRVTDGRGTTTSQFVDFTVVPAVPPTVVITAPAAGDMPMTGNLFSIKASGSATAADHAKITRIDVMDGTTSIYNTTVSTTLVDVPTLGLKSGPHSISLKATDSVGAIGYSDTVNIVLAGPPPATTLTAPEQGGRYGTITSTATITFSGTVAGTAGASISKIELWEGTKLIGTVPVASSTSAAYAFAMGAHTVEWRVTDGRDKSTSLFVDFTVVPSIAPLVTISAPAEGAAIPMYHDTQSINVSGYTTFSDHAKLAKFEVMDGTTSIYATTVSSTLNAVPTLGIKPGPHTIQLRVTDSTGMVGYSEPVHITLTSTPPTAVVTAPVNGATIPTGTSTATVPVTGTAVPNDGATITRIELFENGTLLGASPLSNPATISKAYGLGPHTVEWRVTDSRGMVTRSYTSFVVIAGQAPTVSMSAPADGASYAITAGTSFAVPISASAAAAAPATISKMEVLDGSTVKYTLNNSTVMNTTVALGAGKHALQIRVTDSVGKTALSNIANVMLTVAPPTVVMTAPVNASNYVAPASNVVTVAVKGSATPANGATIVSIDLMEDDKVLQSVSGGTFNANQSFAADGGILGHNIWLRATDSTGQQAASAVSTVIVYSYFPDDAATFIDQTVPTSMRTGQPYNATVRMLNTGGTTWTEAATYRLLSGSPRDNRIWVSTGRGYLAGPVAPGQIATFNIPITAPQKPGVYSFEWRMVRDSVGGWFGNATEPVAIAVADGAGPSAGLTITPSNARMVGNTPVTLTVSANAIETGRKVTKLDVLVDTGHGYSTVPAKSATGTADRLKLDFTTTATAGVYKYKARSTDDLGIQTDSDNLIVNVADSTVLGAVSGVRIDADSKPFLVGWFCQPGAAKQLRYEVLVDAPTVDAGGTPLLTGVANVSGELDDAAVQSSCGTPGVSHNFKVDLSATTEASASVTENTSPAPRLMAMRMASAPVAAAAPVSRTYTNAYAGRALYVHALDVGEVPVVLPCADNSCTMPGSLRVALSSPASGTTTTGPTSLFARTVVSGTTAPVDEVAIGLDGVWTVAQADGATGAYYVNLPDVQPRSAAYTVQSRVRQGNTTVYSVQNLVTIVPNPVTTLTLNSPTGGTAVTGVSMSLSATPGGAADAIAVVRFYANGAAIATGTSNNGNWTASWTPTAAATYTIEARAYDGSSVQLASASVSVVVSGPTSDSVPIPVVVDVPHMSNPAGGTLPGALGVGNDGAATYSIELPVPPGTAGMQPQLSLEYSSLGTNGPLGLGWTLSGLSTIQRCAKTIAQDGVAGRISFDMADRLCMDGQRLVLANSVLTDANYWAINAEYRTETNGFDRITRLANQGFKLEAKDGRISYYGTSGRSALAAPGRADGQVVAWALDRLEDRKGNFQTVDYTYDGSTGEFLPQQMRYGGNTVANTSAELAVRFAYEKRGDEQVRYIGGARSDLHYRLINVQSYVGTAADGSGGKLVRNHTLHYTESQTTGRSLIDWMQACAFNASSGTDECLPKTTFNWGSGSAPTWKQLPIAPFYLPALGGVRTADRGYDADFDGSGKTSFFSTQQTGASVEPGWLRVRLPDGREFDRKLDLTGLSYPNMNQVLIGDLDGDGRDDLFVNTAVGSAIVPGGAYCLTVPAADGTIDFNCHPMPDGSRIDLMTDLRNDKRMHLVATLSTSSMTDCYLANGAMQCDQVSMAGDVPPVNPRHVDGTSPDPYGINRVIATPVNLSAQGISDFYRLYGAVESNKLVGRANVCFSQVQGMVCQNIYSVDAMANQGPYLSSVSNVGDFNNDGITDIVLSVQTMGADRVLPVGSAGVVATDRTVSWVVCLGTESGTDCKQDNGFTPYAFVPGDLISATDKLSDFDRSKVGDFTGDGVVRQLFGVKPNTPGTDAAKSVLCRYGYVGSVCQEFEYSRAFSEEAKQVYLDGSGVPAFLFRTDIHQLLWSAFSLIGPAEADKLVSVTNGVGLREEVTYARGDDADVYSRFIVIDGQERRPVYPQVAVPPGVLVKELRRDNGQGVWLRRQYRFEGKLSDATGRGELGFGKMQVTDMQSGLRTVSLYRQDYPFVGMVASTTVSTTELTPDVSNAPVTISSLQNRWARKDISLDNGAKTVFPFVAGAIEQRADLDGSYLGKTITTGSVTEADVQYDDWGNLIRSRTTALGTWESADAAFVSDIANTYYDADLAHWQVGLLQKTAVTKQQSAGDTRAIVRTTAFTYEPDNSGQIKTMVSEPDNDKLRVTTIFDRSGNSFGLVNRKTLTWRDPVSNTDVSASVTTTYDSQGRFPKQRGNAIGQTETFGYDAATGALLSRLDSNQLKVVWEVDGFGRIASELRPDGNQVKYYLKVCGDGCPSRAALAKITEVVNGQSRISAPGVVYIDAAGHPVQSKTWGFGGRVIVSDQRYDDKGRLHEVDRPRYSDGFAYLERRQHYDALDRVTKLTTTDDSGVAHDAITAYQGMVIVTTNANLHPRTDYFDVLQRLLQTKDAKGKYTKFGYDAFGNRLVSIDPLQRQLVVAYDDAGHRISMDDPDLGLIQYGVNPVGQVLSVSTPKQRSTAKPLTTYKFDLLGRLVERAEPDLISHWVYDQQAGGESCATTYSCGALIEAYTEVDGKKDYQRLHTFDRWGRPASTAQRLSDGIYTNTIGYDAWGRVISQGTQRGQTGPVKEYGLRYNAYGYLERIQDATQVLWRALNGDASLQTTQTLLGNGLGQTRDYGSYTGKLVDAQLLTSSLQIRLHEAYRYDPVGNVLSRSQYWDTHGYQESFTYDELSRLQTSDVMGKANLLTFVYDDAGSIISKTGVGTSSGGDAKYHYPELGKPGPAHGVDFIPGIGKFEYDTNGNMTSGAGRTLEWSSFDMPILITKTGPNGLVSSQFNYGPEHQRIRQIKQDGSQIIYAGMQEVELDRNNQTVSVKTYWPNGTGVDIERANGLTEQFWIHSDRLGSPVALSDRTGALKDYLAYDAWGKRRTLDGDLIGGTATPDSIAGVLDNKGFTGHEMLDDLDLVHMNGRVYDPFTGRVLSGDPEVQDPKSGQSLNRYSYVLNNPTNLVDPSGFYGIDAVVGEVQKETVQGNRLASEQTVDAAAGAARTSQQGGRVQNPVNGRVQTQQPVRRSANSGTGLWSKVSDFLSQASRSFGVFDNFLPSRESFESGASQLMGPCFYNCTGHDAVVQSTADVMQGAGQAVAEAANRYYPDLAKNALLSAVPEMAFAKVAVAPVEKFSEYIFKEGATHGKDAVFRSLGYGAGDSADLAQIWSRQAAAKFSNGQFTLGKLDQYGQRINIEINLQGIGNSAGKASHINSGWMISPNGSIKLNTPFSGFTR